MNALAVALGWGATLAECERNPAEVDRLASELIGVSTRHHFGHWLPTGAIYRGWARSAAGETVEGTAWIEKGVRDLCVTGSVLGLPYFLGLKAEVLHLANRTSEALEAIEAAEKVVERSEQRWWCAEMHRLEGVFLATLGADEAQIEASFCAAIRIAKEQKAVSLEKRRAQPVFTIWRSFIQPEPSWPMHSRD